MLRGWLPLAMVLSIGSALAQPPGYTASSIVNASDYSSGPFAPGSILSIFGSNLSFETAGLNSDNVSATLPISLGDTHVVIDGSSAPLFFVSPGQINVMIPANKIAGNISVQVVRQSMQGPMVTLALVTASPALFVSSGYALAQDYNAHYAVVKPAAPAQAGDVIVLYATGLGGTQPLPALGEIQESPALINGFASGVLQVLLNGKAIDPKTIAYAGLTPGFAGLYQINFLLPSDCPANPQIQVAMGGQITPGNVTLAVAGQ